MATYLFVIIVSVIVSGSGIAVSVSVSTATILDASSTDLDKTVLQGTDKFGDGLEFCFC